MAGPTYDASYNARNQEQQGGGDWVIAGNLQIDRTNGGKLYVDGAEVTASAAELNAQTGVPASVGITPAAGAANVSLVTFQVKDAAGASLAGVFNLDVWLSDAATGAGLTATTASGAVAAGASGTDLGTYTAKKALRVQTDATGKYILSITDIAKTGFYPAAQTPGTGKANVGAQLVAGNYG